MVKGVKYLEKGTHTNPQTGALKVLHAEKDLRRGMPKSGVEGKGPSAGFSGEGGQPRNDTRRVNGTKPTNVARKGKKISPEGSKNFMRKRGTIRIEKRDWKPGNLLTRKRGTRSNSLR